VTSPNLSRQPLTRVAWDGVTSRTPEIKRHTFHGDIVSHLGLSASP
jgi:hypothetical protein